MNDVTAVIVDDEPLARLNIREALSKNTNWHIQAELNGANELYRVMQRLKPDVVFLDIHMPGEKGIEIATKLLKRKHPPYIIFITAYDEYAIQAFELYALDYLLKPFDDERFKKAIERAENMMANQTSSEITQKLQKQILNKDQKLDKILIKSVGSIKIIAIEEISYFISSGNYVEVHHSGGMHLHRIQISFLENNLDSSIFIRVHRSAIVKLSEIKTFKTLDDNRYCVVLSGGQSIKVSSAYKDKLMVKLGVL